MVHEQEMADARVRCFRPLTGMVLIPFYVDEVLPGFSPPYGDGTRPFYDEVRLYQFSPPYGDGTLNISQNIVK